VGAPRSVAPHHGALRGGRPHVAHRADPGPASRRTGAEVFEPLFTTKISDRLGLPTVARSWRCTRHIDMSAVVDRARPSPLAPAQAAAAQTGPPALETAA